MYEIRLGIKSQKRTTEQAKTCTDILSIYQSENELIETIKKNKIALPLTNGLAAVGGTRIWPQLLHYYQLQSGLDE